MPSHPDRVRRNYDDEHELYKTEILPDKPVDRAYPVCKYGGHLFDDKDVYV